LGGGSLVALLNPSHFLGIVVIIRECFVDVCDVQIVPLGDSFRDESALFDAYVYITDGDAAPFYVGLPVNLRVIRGNDSILLGRH
jgi:hypothetical protein